MDDFGRWRCAEAIGDRLRDRHAVAWIFIAIGSRQGGEGIGPDGQDLSLQLANWYRAGKARASYTGEETVRFLVSHWAFPAFDPGDWAAHGAKVGSGFGARGYQLGHRLAIPDDHCFLAALD